MKRIAHRGASGYAPENSLNSFRLAIEMAADGIELDVHLSRDQKLVVIHDETINRTTNRKGFVKNLDACDLQALGVPTLFEVLTLVNRRLFVNIEVKGSGTAAATNELLNYFIFKKKYEIKDFIISSFDWNLLQEIRSLNPATRIAVLTQDSVEEAIVVAEKLNAYAIHPFYSIVSKQNVALMQQKGFKVYPWTVNSDEDIQLLKSFNVNGIITDFLDRI